ncbi:hypothetical protein O1L44_31225 [Streptomyces noursei]|nr:hypothetical protein [Streptomyces noursei]
MFSYPAACDLEEELLELVTMVIVACDGERTQGRSKVQVIK